MKSCAVFLLLPALLMLSACAPSSPQGLYFWGNYEEQLYQMYCTPDKTSAELQVEELEADLEVARAQGRSLPPGFRAHMGYLYFQLGKYDLARQAFTAEKTAFPESTRLMDRFLQKMNGKDA